MNFNDTRNIDYTFTTGRSDEDIRHVSAEAHLKLFWQRPAKDGDLTEPVVNEFSIAPVRLNLPLIEPRVIVGKYLTILFTIDSLTFLKDIERSKTPGSKPLKAFYHIENATSHILTYSLTVGSSDMFAFQGPKELTVRLLPFTRRTVEYVLMPLTRGLLSLPLVKIYDVHYKKTLVPLSATAELSMDKKMLWVVC